MCKTGISRLISALAICTFVAGASAQTPSSAIGDVLAPSRTETVSSEHFQLAKTSLFGHDGYGLRLAAADGRPLKSGFSTARGRHFLLDAGARLKSSSLSAAWPTAASDWGERIDRASTYSISSPSPADEPWYKDEERLITVLAVAVFLLILLR